MESLPPVPVMLRRCGPLLDSVRFAVSVLKWSLFVSALSFVVPLAREWHQLEGERLFISVIIVGFFILLQLMGFRAYWLLMVEGRKTDLCLFLRAFRTDASSDPLRARLKAALGASWHLGGILPPADRDSLRATLLSPLLTGLKYLGSRQFEMVAPDHNWMARLLASFAQTRLVFIDIRDVTPHVLDEIRLAWQVFGLRRTVFIVDARKSMDEWKDEMQSHLEGGRSDFRLLVWNADAAAFVTEVRALLGQIPEGPAEVRPEAVAFVHEKVGEAQWDRRLLDRPGLLIALHLVCVSTLAWLLSLIHPLLMYAGLGVISVKALHLYWKAWRRARRQRLDALAVNPADQSSASRLWVSLVLMLGVLASPLVPLLIGAFLLQGNINQARTARAEADLQAIKIALMSYEARALRCPTTQQGLQALVSRPTAEPVPEHWRQLFEELPLDPWQHPYRYEIPARRAARDPYDLWSAGPDGIDRTADDIGNFNAQ